MNKKKIIILIIALVLLVYGIHYAIRTINDNYRFGADLYINAGTLSVEFNTLVHGINVLEDQCQNPDRYPDGIQRISYDFAIVNCCSSRVYSDMETVFLQDECKDLYHCFSELYEKTVNDSTNLKLENLFTDKEKFEEVAALRDQLCILIEGMEVFRERYEEMSVWERYFASWEDERKILSELVSLPQSNEA